AAVQLDQIDVVGREAAQAALDAGQEWRAPPVGARPAAGVPALREQRDVPASGSERLADQALAVVVALRGVDHVQPGVERAPEQPRDRAGAHALIPDLRAAEAEHARHDVGAAEPTLLHRRRHGPSRYHGAVARVTRWRQPKTSEEDAHDDNQRSRTSGAGGPRLLSDRAGAVRPGADAGAAHGPPCAAHDGARRPL